MLLRHMVSGLIVFSIMITLFTTSYINITEDYSVPKDTLTINGEVKEFSSLGERMKELKIVDEVNKLTKVFKENDFTTITDILGGLSSFGLGLVKSILGIFTFPFEMASIISDYYMIPPILVNGLLAILCVYIAFIIISAYTRGDL